MKPESFLSSETENDNIDLLKIFRLLLLQSKFIILIVLSALILSIAYFIVSTKQYKIVSLVQYEAFDQKVFDPSQALQLAYPGSSTSDISNMIQLYESRTNYLKVIKDLKLNIDIQDLEDDESISINISHDGDDLVKIQKLKFSFSENEYNLLDQDLNKIHTSRYGENVYFENLKINIESIDLNNNRPIDIYYRNPESMFSSFKSGINVKSNSSKSSFFTSEGLITVSYITDDKELGKEIINYANNVFLNQRIYDESEKSRKAIIFIDENIKSINETVERNKIRLKQFREKNKSIDVNLEIEGIIKKIQSLEESLNAIDIEIAKAKEIYTPNNPAYLNLVSKKMLIETQKEEVLNEVKMMPKEQQEYIDLFNNLEVSQASLGELEARRLGFSLLEASTIADVRVVDEAYVEAQVSPTLLSVILTTFLALIFSCIAAVIRGMYFLPITNPAEIFDNNIYMPIIGVIPKVDDIQSSDDDIRLNSSIETLIVNINSMQEDNVNKNLITITSPSPSNGKSTVSMKLAEGFSRIGKKVLLVDNDLKRGKLHKSYKVESISERRFNLIDQSTINQYKIKDNLYFIPRVKGLNNTIQFLYGKTVEEKINFFKEYFDFVIFDTGPVLSVADASILVDKSDLNLIIARHGYNKINEIKQVIDNFNQINKNIDGIVYNAYEKPNSYYGYYSLYGNYSYQYYADKYLDDTYEYEKK